MRASNEEWYNATLRPGAALSIIGGCLTALLGILVFAGPKAPDPPPVPTILSLTGVLVCGEPVGLLAVETGGTTTFYPEPMEPGLAAGLMDKSADNFHLIAITGRICGEEST